MTRLRSTLHLAAALLIGLGAVLFAPACDGPSPAQCTSSADCLGTESCVDGVCKDGPAVQRDAGSGADAGLGGDAGSSADAGSGESECSNDFDDDGDELVDCADPDCRGSVCTGALCGLPGICAAGVCNQQPAPAQTVCREVSGICDVAEVCEGNQLECPPESFLPEGEPCGACNVCDGLGGCLPLLDGTSCDSGKSCHNGACVTCGGEGQPCCDETVCSGAGLSCQDGLCLLDEPPDAGWELDAGWTTDAGITPDAGVKPDAGVPPVVKKTIAMVADIVQKDRVAAARQVAALIKAHTPRVEFIAAGGDNARYGKAMYSNGFSLLEFFRLYWAPATAANWGQFDNITFPALGNHEYNAPNARGHFLYFKNRLDAIAARPGTHGFPNVEGKGYYSFDINGWHFVALNSNCAEIGGCGATSPQHTWLKNDLANHRNMPIIGFFHHPPFWCASNPFQTNASVRPLWLALHDAGADFVFTGHSHFYQRFRPLSRDMSTAVAASAGVTHLIVGNTGVSPQGNCPNPPARLVKQAGGEAGLGAFFLTLGNDGSYAFQYKTRNGTVVDSGSGWSRHRP